MSLRQQLHSDFLAIVSAGSSVLVWQEQIDWALRILVSIVGLVAGAVTIYQRLKKRAPRP